MTHRIEVATREELADVQGKAVCERISSDLGISVLSVRTIDIYTLLGDLETQELQSLARNLFSDNVSQRSSVDSSLLHEMKWEWCIEVGYKPGVMDAIGLTATEEISDLISRNVQAFSSRQYLLTGSLNRQSVELIARNLLCNELIERYSIYDSSSWTDQNALAIPMVELKHQSVIEEINLNISDDDLLRMSRERLLALNLEEMQVIRDHIKSQQQEREEYGLSGSPTDAELESLAQNWSEHCKHKIFRGLIKYDDNELGTTENIDSLFRRYIRGSTAKIAENIDWLVSVFEDNAGVIKLDDDYNLVFKVETHNSPSALDPYGGALTGIVGVNRDPMGTGLGCRLLFNTDVFCFADPNYGKPLPVGLKHPKRIFEGVRLGVEHGGNKSGIPTVNGSLRFDERFLGKPLVYCGTGGIMPARVDTRLGHEKEILPGDLIVMVGGRIGADGIHGATFSSEALTEDSPTTAVQLGNPFTQKIMADMLNEALSQGLYRAIHDNGAGGLCCAAAELAGRSNGSELHLDKAPLKYPGLQPWEILLSESQERMTLGVAPENIEAFLELANRRDVEATVVGTFTDSGKFHVLYNGETAAYLDVDFVLEGHPQKKMKATWTKPKHNEPDFREPQDLAKELHKLLGRLNICSKESLIRQYDHEVQGTSVIKPMTGAQNDGPSDASVIWPIEMMQKDSKRGFVVSNGINPNYGDIDAYHMTALVLDEAIRNAVAVGADPKRIAVLDNFSWSSPDDEFSLAQLVRSCKALYDFTIAFGTPLISGKDSMYNDFEGELDGKRVKISVPPTLLVSALGIIEDISKAVTMDLKEPGNLIYLLGDSSEELGGSEYFTLKGEEIGESRFVGNGIPILNAASALRIYENTHQAMSEGLIRSCHDCSEGGLGVALAEMSFAGGMGLEINLTQIPGADYFTRNDFLLFSESPSRLILEIRPENQQRFESICAGSKFGMIGKTKEDPVIHIAGLNRHNIIAESIDLLKQTWQRPLDWS
jgi:phosphoribosylformylglycinamidine synthase